MEYLLSTHALTKRYGKKISVNKVNIHIKQGDIYGLIGRKDAGKTTMLKLISGLAKNDEGDMEFFGYKGKELSKVRTRIGVMIDNPGVYMHLSAEDNLIMKSIALGVRGEESIQALLAEVGLEDAGKMPVKKFSLGMKIRLGLAMALVGNPDVVLLDEPLTGLDSNGLADVIVRLNQERGITFIITGNSLEEISKISTRYGIMNNGELLIELSNEELLNKCKERIELKADDASKALVVLDKMGIKEYKVIDANTIEIFERLNESGEITMILAKDNVKTLSIQIKKESLEEYYYNVIGGSRNA